MKSRLGDNVGAGVMGEKQGCACQEVNRTDAEEKGTGHKQMAAVGLGDEKTFAMDYGRKKSY